MQKLSFLVVFVALSMLMVHPVSATDNYFSGNVSWDITACSSSQTTATLKFYEGGYCRIMLQFDMMRVADQEYYPRLRIFDGASHLMAAAQGPVGAPTGSESAFASYVDGELDASWNGLSTSYDFGTAWTFTSLVEVENVYIWIDDFDFFVPVEPVWNYYALPSVGVDTWSGYLKDDSDVLYDISYWTWEINRTNAGIEEEYDSFVIFSDFTPYVINAPGYYDARLTIHYDYGGSIQSEYKRIITIVNTSSMGVDPEPTQVWILPDVLPVYNPQLNATTYINTYLNGTLLNNTWTLAYFEACDNFIDPFGDVIDYLSSVVLFPVNWITESFVLVTDTLIDALDIFESLMSPVVYMIARIISVFPDKFLAAVSLGLCLDSVLLVLRS